MEFCYRQSILGIVFGGLEISGETIPKEVLYQWIAFAENIKAQNMRVDKDCLQVSDYFRNKNIKGVILKGQANGRMYPKPELRSPGDIDIWVDREDLEIISLILKDYPAAHYSFHHVKLPMFKDVSVEVHYRPIFLNNWLKNKILQSYIKSVEAEQFSNLERFCGRETGCLTTEFDAVYQLLHMFHHLFTTRNNFKQFIDYYYLLLRVGTDECKLRIRSQVTKLGLQQYAKGVLWIMKDILGMEKKFLFDSPDEKMGKVILHEAMRYGSFSNNKLKKIVQMFAGNLRLILNYPGEVFSAPLFLLWHQWWRLKIYFKLQR